MIDTLLFFEVVLQSLQISSEFRNSVKINRLIN
jgi:hypothetical protein